ncbi:hypothetical protein M404DRAFT_22287 [Pisolithus tinctorius Marx 270]|uniref:Uncharacterized protein n=1 Tax=Pisolithus tinctorius Marx 270 TaxID=870435 RepID=A0A0C3P6V3_PISTI|nr:hypothetical protein M404DRAFT_22287 [Pisolithus tinctorius Marx 270]
MRKEVDTVHGAEEDNEMSGEEEDDDTDLDKDEGSSSKPDDVKSDDNDGEMVAGLDDNKNLKPCHDVAIQTDSKETKEQAMQASDPSLTQADNTMLTVKCEPTLQDVENVKFSPCSATPCQVFKQCSPSEYFVTPLVPLVVVNKLAMACKKLKHHQSSS